MNKSAILEKVNFENDKFKPTDNGFNIKIFNILNLYNPDLAIAYEERGFNPFEKEFNFCVEYVEKLLEIQKNKEAVSSEKFLERGNKEVSELFSFALENTRDLLSSLSIMKPEIESLARMEDFKIFLKNRIELLTQAIVKLKNQNQDSFKLYQDMVALNLEYSELIKDTFLDKFNRDLVIMNFFKFYNFGKKQKTPAQEKEEALLAHIFLFNQLDKSKEIKSQKTKTVNKNLNKTLNNERLQSPAVPSPAQTENLKENSSQTKASVKETREVVKPSSKTISEQKTPPPPQKRQTKTAENQDELTL